MENTKHYPISQKKRVKITSLPPDCIGTITNFYYHPEDVLSFLLSCRFFHDVVHCETINCCFNVLFKISFNPKNRKNFKLSKKFPFIHRLSIIISCYNPLSSNEIEFLKNITKLEYLRIYTTNKRDFQSDSFEISSRKQLRGLSDLDQLKALQAMERSMREEREEYMYKSENKNKKSLVKTNPGAYVDLKFSSFPNLDVVLNFMFLDELKSLGKNSLDECTKLRKISLTKCEDPSFFFVKNTKNLVELELLFCKFSLKFLKNPKNFECFKSLKYLECFRIKGCDVETSYDTYKELDNLQNESFVVFSLLSPNLKICDIGQEPKFPFYNYHENIKNLANLKEIGIGPEKRKRITYKFQLEYDFDSVKSSYFQNFKKLKILRIRQSKNFKDGFLRSFGNLEYFSIIESNIKEINIDSFKYLQSLKSFSLIDCSHSLTDEVFKHLKKLEVLELVHENYKSKLFSNSQLLGWGCFKKLKKLRIDAKKLASEGLSMLFKSCKEITTCVCENFVFNGEMIDKINFEKCKFCRKIFLICDWLVEGNCENCSNSNKSKRPSLAEWVKCKKCEVNMCKRCFKNCSKCGLCNKTGACNDCTRSCGFCCVVYCEICMDKHTHDEDDYSYLDDHD